MLRLMHQTAKKMGFNVISVSTIVDEQNPDVIYFYNKIGIHVASELTDLQKMI